MSDPEFGTILQVIPDQSRCQVGHADRLKRRSLGRAGGEPACQTHPNYPGYAV